MEIGIDVTMPALLALDIVSLSLSVVLCAALALIVASSGMRRSLNRYFVLFAIMEAGWAATSVVLRLTLWFHTGNPEALLELSTSFFAFMGPFLFLFSARYVSIKGRWPLWIAGGVLAVILLHVLPLIKTDLVLDPLLQANGVVSYRFTAWGFLGSALPAVCFLVSLVFLWSHRDRQENPAIRWSTLLLLAGYIAGGIIILPFPIMSLTNTVSVAVLGWGIVRRQLFNPLRNLAADLRERAHRQELTTQISRRTAALLELDDLLTQAVTLIQETFQYLMVGIFLVDGEMLVLSASTLATLKPHLKSFRLKIGVEGICGWVAEHGKPIVVGDVGRDLRYRSLSATSQTRSEIAVPIMRSDKVIGVLDIQSASLDAFDEKDLVTQQTIADQLSSSIENARLYEETRRRAERLTLLNRISAASGSVLDLDDLLRTVYREVTPIFEADAFFIALYDPDAKMLDFRIQVDEGVIEPPVRETMGGGLTSRVILTRKPLLANDIGVGRLDVPRPEAWGSGKLPSSWIGVPMLIGDRIIGVLSVQTYRTHLYEADDLLLAATIADQVAVAVENARLYEEARQELDVRLRTEKVLRESEEKFRNLAEQSPNIIFIYCADRFVYINEQCELILGYSPSQMCSPGFDFRSITAPGYEMVIAENFRMHREGQEAQPYECVLVTRAARRIDVIMTTKLIRYDGEPAILGIMTDITNRMRTERLVQSLNAAALAMEQALTPSEIFPAAARVLCGLGFDSAVLLLEPEGSRSMRTHCWGSGARGEVRVMEGGNGSGEFQADDIPEIARALDGKKALFAAFDPDGAQALRQRTDIPLGATGESPNDFVLAPLLVGEALFGMLIVNGHDLGPEDLQVFTAFAHQAAAAWRKTRLMGDLEESLRQLRQTQQELLHAQKMEAIGRLAGGIAHDFNNILTVISGYTSLMMDEVGGNASALSDLDQIRGTIKRASALTSRLLSFSRKQILQPSVFDLNKVVANSVTLLRPLIGEDIELVMRLAPSVLSVRADHYQIEQVLMNLAVNARDAMSGGGRLTLETGVAEVAAGGAVALSDGGVGFDARLPQDITPGEWVVMKFQDNGIGMSAEVRSHIFEPFFTTKDEGKGSGLGLSTVYGIVTQSNGRIRVDSISGRGTTFTLCLPRVSPARENDDADRPSGEDFAGSGTVLLVEDEPDVRELARRVLQKAGYQVVPVASAHEALLVAEGSTVLDCVVTDIVMPGGMSGVEMGQRLSRTRPTLPILYMSGYTDDLRFPVPASGGTVPFLGKPFQPDELLKRVREITRRFQSRS
jgi:PAS domain S-box-containing protein